MYNMLDETLELLCYLADGWCLAWFCGRFLESRLQNGKWTGFLVIVCYVITKKIPGMIFRPDYENISYESLLVISMTACSFLVLIILLAGFYKVGRFMRLFLALTFLSVHETGYLLVYTVWQKCYSLLMDAALWAMEKGYLSAEGLINFAWIGGYGMIFFTKVTFLVILFITLRQIEQSYHNKEYPMHRRELFFLLAPEATGLLICTMLRIIMIVVEQEKPVLLYDKYPVLVLLVPLIMLLSLLSIPHGVKVFQGLIDLNREKSGRIILENQLSGMQKQIEEMEHIYASIRSMKHDMRNTVSVMMQLALDENGNRSLQEYLSELGRSFDALEFRYRTGNVVVDTLLNMKYHEISRTLPELELEADRLFFPESLHIQSYDIGVILGNALDNAAEACGRLHEKENGAALFIHVSSFRKGNMFFLEVENSFDGQIVKKAQMEFPETSKPDKSAHGLGLINIRNAADKYHGAVDWLADGRVFILSVMLQNETGKSGFAEGKEG